MILLATTGELILEFATDRTDHLGHGGPVYYQDAIAQANRPDEFAELGDASCANTADRFAS